MFITFEGIEGSGKTTQIGVAAEYLENKGQRCVITREPGGTEIGERIRAILLDPASRGLDPMAELLLYMADRAQHLKAVVRKNLSQGRIVLCDRYFDATVVYQGYARGLNVNMIQELHCQAFNNLKPDLTFVLDLTPELGLERAWRQLDNGGRVTNESRFEEEKIAFHQKVRDGYLRLADLEPDRFRIVDAAQEIARVSDCILAGLAEWGRERKGWVR